MLYGEKSREELNAHAEKLFKKNYTRTETRSLYDDIQRKFGLSIRTVDEMIHFRKDIREYSTFEVFAVVWFLDRDCLNKYFTQKEIDFFSNEKIEEEKVQFPITFDNMVQIADDQFIGKITAKQLMKLKAARLINYDADEQRALSIVKSGGIEIYKPFVNLKSVREIKNLMRDGKYIPDPLTLNMPDGSDFSFSDNTLTIYSLPTGMMNLDDGYHRYLAISQLHDEDESFDYTMELRIINFSNPKANSFIFQQDQKTKMKKVVSDSYNSNAIANKIVQRLNQDPSSNIQGMIGRNDANINSSALAKLIDYFFVEKKYGKSVEMSQVVIIKNDLVVKFNLLTEQDQVFFDKYDNPLLFVTVFVLSSNVDPQKYAEIILAIYDELSDEEKGMMDVVKAGTVRKRAVNILTKKIAKYE